MRKLLLALPLVASASWAGTTYYAGTQTQPAYDKLISQLNEFKPFTVESEQYNAGFLTSTAITKVMNSAGPDAQTLFRLQHVIEHSPVGVDGNGARVGASTIHTTLLVDEYSEEVTEFLAAFDNQQPFELFTRVGISGAVTNDLVLSPFSINRDGSEASFEGGQYTVNSDNTGAIAGEGELGAIVLANNVAQYSVSASTGVFDLQRISAGIHTGNYSFDIPEIAFINKESGTKDGRIADIKLTSNTEFEGALMNSDLQIVAGSVETPLDISSASFEFNIGGLSLQGLQEYVEIMESLPIVGDDPDYSDSLVASDFDAYKALISPGAKMGLDLAMENSGGAISTSFDAKFKGDGSVSGYDSMGTIRDLASAHVLSLKINADEAALHATPAVMVLLHPMAQQYLLSDGISYSTDIKAEDLILEVNGNPQSLEDMFGGILSMPLDLSMLSAF